MRGQWGQASACQGRVKARPQNYFFFSALASGLASAFLSPAAAAFASPLAGAFSPAFPAGAASAPSSFFSLVISTSPAAGAASVGDHFLFGARRGDGDDGDVFVTQNLHARGRLDFAKVNGLANFETGHVNDNLFRQIFRQRADLELEQNVFEHAAAGFYADGFAGRFHRHLDGDFFVLGDFVKINVQHLAVERMMLDFLHQREALGAGVVLDGQIHEHIFRNGMVEQVGKFLGVDLQVLRRGLAAVNGGGHAAGRAEFFDFGALHLRTRISFQCD